MAVVDGSPPLPLVILGTGDGSVRALDGRDGSTRWQFAAGSNHPFFRFALATDRGSVYAAAGDGLVVALRLDDGSLLWQHELPYAGPPVGHRFDMDVRVMAGGGVVAVSMGRQDTRRPNMRSITVLDGATGAQRWVFTPRSPAWRRLQRALGPLTGYFPDPVGATLLAVDATGVYVTTSSQTGGKAPTCVTVVRDLRRGRQRWRTRRAAAQIQFPSGSSRTSLTVAGGVIYTLDTHLSALEASTGRIRWQRPAPPASRTGVLSADAAVVCAACDSLFAVYWARDGAALWQLDRRDGNGPFLGMALMGETVYVSGGDSTRRDGFTLEARDAVTGTLRWTWPAPSALEQGQEQEEFPARGDLSSRFVGAGGMLYVPGPDTLCAVRASDGAQLWQRQSGSAFPALVAV
ncbi:MAG: outer membrane protein assembly factor BamB family protein [Ktedonobacterales bacterium]